MPFARLETCRWPPSYQAKVKRQTENAITDTRKGLSRDFAGRNEEEVLLESIATSCAGLTMAVT